MASEWNPVPAPPTWPREQPRREPGKGSLVSISVAGVPIWTEGERLTRDELDRRVARAAAALDEPRRG
jgi:hypothetical protein